MRTCFRKAVVFELFEEEFDKAFKEEKGRFLDVKHRSGKENGASWKQRVIHEALGPIG